MDHLKYLVATLIITFVAGQALAHNSVKVTVTKQRGTETYTVHFSRPLEFITPSTSPGDLLRALQAHPQIINPRSVKQLSSTELQLQKQPWEDNGYRYVEECELAQVLLSEIKANITCREIKWDWSYDPCIWKGQKRKLADPCPAAWLVPRYYHWYDWPRWPLPRKYGVPRVYTALGRFFFLTRKKTGERR